MILVMHFFLASCYFLYLYFIHMLCGKKNVIMLECLKLGWNYIFTHATNDQSLSEKNFHFHVLKGLKMYPDNGKHSRLSPI
jgi:hypothetical protein